MGMWSQCNSGMGVWNSGMGVWNTGMGVWNMGCVEHGDLEQWHGDVGHGHGKGRGKKRRCGPRARGHRNVAE